MMKWQFLTTEEHESDKHIHVQQVKLNKKLWKSINIAYTVGGLTLAFSKMLKQIIVVIHQVQTTTLEQLVLKQRFNISS